MQVFENTSLQKLIWGFK
ncbi:hypothetical protein E2C01_082257 [Portunus trituberculatus]|uniref:Uncharacterized protein n=1 Tax=Portunus trituberculatus TaxID=210409 RepID=A0A5B7J0B8_PORTR|nr:hypothetical protein [Portunus trituberculatus]